MRWATEQDVYRAHMDAISIHAPRAGGDLPSIIHGMASGLFQSTPPVRGATVGEFFLIASKWQPFVGLTFGV